MVHQCGEREKYLRSLSLQNTEINNQIASIELDIEAEYTSMRAEIADEISDTMQRINMMEERICAVNNMAAQLENQFHKDHEHHRICVHPTR